MWLMLSFIPGYIAFLAATELSIEDEHWAASAASKC